MKQLKRDDVLDLINDLRPRPKLWPEMRLNQLVGFYLGVTYGFEAIDTGGGFSFWMDMGSGKTLVTLELLKYWRQCGELNRALVFVLSHHAYATWERQIERFKIGLPYVSLEGSSDEKWHALHTFKDGIVLCSYPGAVAMLCDKVPELNRNKQPTGKMKMQLLPKLLTEFRKNVDVLVMDESTRAGHSGSLSNRMCSHIADRVAVRYALAGLPFGREPELLFHQQKIIDGGASFGETVGMFREAFYSKQQNIWSKSSYSFKYTFNKGMTSKFSAMMQHRSITYTEHECSDVPDMVNIVVPVKMRGEQREYYHRASEEILMLAKKGGADYVAIKNSFLRMRQVTSGFLGFKKDDTGERASITFTENPKLDALMEKLVELPDDRKAVVFYEYTYSGKRIVEELNKAGIKCIWLWAGTKNPRKEMDKFMKRPDYTVAVLNTKVGTYSLDGFQEVANYLFYYESPVAVIDRKQGDKRIKRPGQKHRVWCFDLVCSGTVDERILDFHQEGTDLMKAVRKDPKVLL
jgi:hypothetical protein